VSESVEIQVMAQVVYDASNHLSLQKQTQGLEKRAYTAGATAAFLVVERLMFLACSLTRDFASIMLIPAAFEERHRTYEGEMALGAPFTRIVAAGNDMAVRIGDAGASIS
jgi:hypothetical protein